MTIDEACSPSTRLSNPLTDNSLNDPLENLITGLVKASLLLDFLNQFDVRVNPINSLEVGALDLGDSYTGRQSWMILLSYRE